MRKKREIYRQWKQGGLGRTQQCHPHMQKWDNESQGECGTELGEGCEKYQ